jgi:ubiquitin carboxyl-terminal hydrolase 5/13
MLVTEEILAIVRSHFGSLKIPSPHDKVYNDECAYSFASPFSEGGLYVNILSFLGFGAEFYLEDSEKSGCKLYLHEKFTQVPKSHPENEPSKLAIGVEGGFAVGSKYDVVKQYSLVVVGDSTRSNVSIPLPNQALPEFVSNVLQTIIDHAGARSLVQVESWDDEQDVEESKYAEGLVQLDNGKKIPCDPKQWKCEKSGDTQNLWLNLSTGYIGGGRKNWDGSGGSGAALEHFQDTGSNYPLCVKLGTITPQGADIWSYAPDEDTLVKDSKLAQHLSHWGIDIMRLEKTDKTLGEMNVDLNKSYDWSKILETGKNLVAIHQPGFVGLSNLGNSCYMNSVIQTILCVPEIRSKYIDARSKIISTAPKDPTGDLATQLSKVGTAIFGSTFVLPSDSNDTGDGEYEIKEKYKIKPFMFKKLVASGNREFLSGRQQDASEYFGHLLSELETFERAQSSRLDTDKSSHLLFEYSIEDRIEFPSIGKVKYSLGDRHNILELAIPLEAATNKEQVNQFQEAKRVRLESASPPRDVEGEEIKLDVPFEACLASLFSEEEIDFTLPEAGRVKASKTSRMATFPRFLMIKLGRYAVNTSWQTVKVDATVNVPKALDLTAFKAKGLQSGEVLMEDSTDTTNPPDTTEVIADQEIVSSLVSMGFSENGCRKAAIATKNNGTEAAMNWVLEHMGDPDFNDPPATNVANNSISDNVDSEAILLLSSMGFTSDQARCALKRNNSNVELAANWLFSGADVEEAMALDLATEVSNSAPTATNAECTEPDAPGKYSLVAIISHLGQRPDHGHYVCHIKRNGVWALFNDDKVALANDPPFERGFMYLFRRDDVPEE